MDQVLFITLGVIFRMAMLFTGFMFIFFVVVKHFFKYRDQTESIADAALLSLGCAIIATLI